MNNDTERINREQLDEAVGVLTEENQRHFLGVLEALTFAQIEQSEGGETGGTLHFEKSGATKGGYK